MGIATSLVESSLRLQSFPSSKLNLSLERVVGVMSCYATDLFFLVNEQLCCQTLCSLFVSASLTSERLA